MAYVLAIDQGTTNTKAQLVAQSGAVAARASRPVTIHFPQPGWVEQDAREIWQSVRAAMGECLAAAAGDDVVAVGVSNQRESVLLWDRRTGAPLGPCITWQCRRTSGTCDRLRERGLEPSIRATTGLPIDPLFSASKAAWLLDRADPDRVRARAGDLCVGTVDSWLIWQLNGGTEHVTDVTNASRTQLLNLRSVRWDDDLIDLFGVPAACLPQVRSSSGDFGRTVSRSGIPESVPIAAAIGDSHAALFGHAAFCPGMTKATYGTGSSLMTPFAAGALPAASQHGLASTIAWGLGDRNTYALEGNITNTGATIQWLGEILGDGDPVMGVVQRAERVANSAGVHLVPAFAGLGAPYWDAGARGAIVGLTRGSTAAHLAYAALDSIAHQVCDVLEAMNADTGTGASALLADGGASRNSTLMQRQADLAGCAVRCDRSGDVSIRGAAWLAGLAVGFWDSLDALGSLPRDIATFHPALSRDDRREARAGWKDAVSRVRSLR